MNESPDFITRCPSCNTSFRVTSEQIDTADGAVRCGACLRIFQADEQLVSESTADSSDDLLIEADSPSGPSESRNSEFVAPSSEDSANEASLQRHTVSGLTTPEQTVPGQPMREELDQEINTNQHGRLERPESEEKLSGNFVGVDNSVETSIQAAAVSEGVDEIRYEDKGSDEIVPELNGAEQINVKQSEYEVFNADEIEYEDISIEEDLGDHQENHDLLADEWHEVEVVFDKFTSVELEEKYWQDWEEYLSDLNEISNNQESECEDDNAAGPLAQQETHLIPGLDLGHDPDELVGELKREERLSPLWIVATIVLLISGSLQYLWYNKEVYAQDTSYRSYYLVMCDWIGCKLPEYRNRQNLVAKNLLIRSHPQIESALIVDAILRNSGQYRQKFPDLRLWFRDIENAPIAARRFSPADYLAGELRGLRFIPGHTEVRFSIEITDPGESALGYSLEVLPQG
jgi:predicted Zn finger-like uncharacterized protein